MAVHRHPRGLGVITYRFRFGPLTPAWLDRAETPLTRFLSRTGGRLHLLRREYRD